MKRDALLAILRENRTKHRELYEKAYAVFGQKAIENIESMLQRAKSGEIRLHVNLTEPQDHTEDYDRAIMMLEHELRDVIELSQGEYAQLVQDQWGWQQRFTETNAGYGVQ